MTTEVVGVDEEAVGVGVGVVSYFKPLPVLC